MEWVCMRAAPVEAESDRLELGSQTVLSWVLWRQEPNLGSQQEQEAFPLSHGAPLSPLSLAFPLKMKKIENKTVFSSKSSY